MTRNKSSVFVNIGASSHSKSKREEHDYYTTDPLAITILHRNGLLDNNNSYFDFCCGGGNLGNELRRLGYHVEYESDLYDRGHGDIGVDFFTINQKVQGNTIANPPYKHINDWIAHSLKITSNKVYIFCRIQTIESMKRYQIFKKNPPILICPFVKRVKCYKNDDRTYKSSAVCYAWFIWDNTVDNTETKVKWLV